MLFRSLFRGREDIYSRRFENHKTGKSGYSLVCSNEWVRDVCKKPKIKCLNCPNRRFLPITDEVIEWHLLGKDNKNTDFVMGIYPMLLDETCFFLAVDFDKTTWEQDAVAFLDVCHQKNLPAILERSRSGKGGHIWLFFTEAVPASLARKLGSYLLTETMEYYPDVGLDSYDRFFPNQDTLPKGGFGNLIALPLQKKARYLNNSVFVDRNLIPYEDQWEFLSKVKKIDKKTVEDMVALAEAKGKTIGVRLDLSEEDNLTPWKLSSLHSETILAEGLPEKIMLIVSHEIFIEKAILFPPLRNRLLRLAAFQNPEFYKAQAMRLSVYEIPRIIGCAHDYSHHIGLPRGCLDEVCQLFKDLKIKFTIEYELSEGEPIECKFSGKLRSEQQAAAQTILKFDMGVLSATTAFGKTVIAAWLITQRKVSTLVIVHRKQLQEQWIERLNIFLNLANDSAGKIGKSSKKSTGICDVLLVQSLVRKDNIEEFLAKYGHIIVDECHHLPAVSFEKIIRLAKSRFITGLSATVKRKDGHHPIITMRCGPVRYQVTAKEQVINQPFEHIILARPTGFFSIKPKNEDLRIQFQDLYNELIQDEERNKLICSDVLAAVKNGRSPIILTERNEHLDFLADKIKPFVQHLIILRGGMTAKELNKVNELLKNISAEEERVILATGRFIGEGFDDARLDTLFLTLPISWQGTIAQYVGRLHRLYDSKKEVQVYDYADLSVPMLERMFNRRCKTYEAIGYKILLPASAISGWPSTVILPVEPKWKADYSATINRLISDGVDLLLADLFKKATVNQSVELSDFPRARSAIEAFLYRRLETLPQTAGQFQLNVEISIPFNGLSCMEIDLLCEHLRIAIEIDGKQHLDNEEAYRRDRRKDVLLQENGYLVLRFLAEDISKSLDDVLNIILRVVACKNKEKTLLSQMG